MAADPQHAAPDDPLAIDIQGVKKAFPGQQTALPAVDIIDLHVNGGTTTALVGPSGCGKSTLLRLVAGLDTPDEGNVILGGQTPHTCRATGDLAMAFQEDALLPWRTLTGNIALGRKLARLPPSPTRVAELIKRVGLSGFEARRPAELSGGMRQRAAIARCLATAPRVLLLDEPFGAVDALTRRRLNIELPPVWGVGHTTVLLVTHSVTEAVFLADRVVVLSPRPATVVNSFDVSLSRPRNAKMLEWPEFTETVRAIEATLTRSGREHPGDLAAE